MELIRSEKSGTGFKGVHKKGQGFTAQFPFQGQKVYLGHFPTAVEAAAAYSRHAHAAAADAIVEKKRRAEVAASTPAAEEAQRAVEEAQRTGIWDGVELIRSEEPDASDPGVPVDTNGDKNCDARGSDTNGDGKID